MNDARDAERLELDRRAREISDREARLIRRESAARLAERRLADLSGQIEAREHQLRELDRELLNKRKGIAA